MVCFYHRCLLAPTAHPDVCPPGCVAHSVTWPRLQAAYPTPRYPTHTKRAEAPPLPGLCPASGPRAPAFNAAVDGGLQMFDTAEIYAMGKSEEYLGRFLKERLAQAGASGPYVTGERGD